MIRRAFVKAMEERFPNQPLPRPFTVYENVDEPAWMRPWGWTVPRPEDVADEPDPFGPLDWEQEAKAEDEERALARAMKAGAAMYGGAPVIIAKPRGRPPGRPSPPLLPKAGSVEKPSSGFSIFGSRTPPCSSKR